MNIRSSRPWLGVVFLSTAMAAVCTSAADPVGDERLTLREALELAAERNPDLKPSLLELPALDGRRQQAGLRPNPELALELENVPGTGSFDDGGRTEVTLALSQLIELGDKRGLRVGVADAAYDVAEREIAVRRLDLAAEVLRRFLRAARAQERLQLGRRRMELDRRTHDAVEVRVKAARSPQAELHRARAALYRARLDEGNAQSELTASLYSLAALWGDPSPPYTGVEADLYALPPVLDFDDLLDRVRSSPDLERLLTEGRLRDAEFELARAAATPDVTVGGGIRRLEESDDFALVLSLEMPVPFYDRNQGAIREALVRREQADARYDAALNRARADLFSFYQELLQARAAVESLRGRVIPELEEAGRQTQIAYDGGRYSYIELVDAQRSLLDARSALIDAATRYHAVLAEIERLTGQRLAIPSQPRVPQ